MKTRSISITQRYFAPFLFVADSRKAYRLLTPIWLIRQVSQQEDLLQSMAIKCHRHSILFIADLNALRQVLTLRCQEEVLSQAFLTKNLHGLTASDTKLIAICSVLQKQMVSINLTFLTIKRILTIVRIVVGAQISLGIYRITIIILYHTIVKHASVHWRM